MRSTPCRSRPAYVTLSWEGIPELMTMSFDKTSFGQFSFMKVAVRYYGADSISDVGPRRPPGDLHKSQDDLPQSLVG